MLLTSTYDVVLSMKIVLIGYMGSGKSLIGKGLSEKLQYQFKDLDLEIESSEENTINNIFSSKGEIYFRKKEAAVLSNILQLKENIILATGGGTPCYGNVMETLNTADNVITIYLRTSLPILTKRLFLEKEHRPLISHLRTTESLNDFIRKHLFERSFYYNQADISISTDEGEVDKMVRDIIAQLF